MDYVKRTASGAKAVMLILILYLIFAGAAATFILVDPFNVKDRITTALEIITGKRRKTQELIGSGQTNLQQAKQLSQKEALTEDEKRYAAGLLQAAIQDLKQATRLEPDNPETWYQLALVYDQLIGVAAGSEQWAVSSYQKALELYPETNPRRQEIRNSIDRIQAGSQTP